MKNGKSKRKTLEESPYSKPQATSITSRLRIKFEITRTNTSCFIGEKRQNKKTLPKRQQTQKIRRSLKKQKVSVSAKQQGQAQKSVQKKRPDQSPDIIKESANSIISQIEQKGIGHDWTQSQQLQQTVQKQQLANDNSEIWSAFSVTESLQKSYASTMDYQHQAPIYYHSIMHMTQPTMIEYKQRSQSFEGNVFQIRLQQIGLDARTTIMIRNIPNKYTIKDLSDQIDYYFNNTYDFLYLPCDLNNQCNVGYGFINFLDTAYLREFYLAFHKNRWGKFRSEKICILAYARLQGLQSLIEHFENSKVLNAKEKKYRPIIKANTNSAKLKDLIKNQQQN